MRKCKSVGCKHKPNKNRIKYRKNQKPRFWCAHCGRKL